MPAMKVSSTKDISRFLKSGMYIDSDSTEVRNFTTEALKGLADKSDTACAIQLFNVVRDNIRYNPYSLGFNPEQYRASNIIKQHSAFCVPKAILLTACLRAAGIPAAVGFADVRNHINSPKLTELMQTDLFIYHGYVKLWLDGKSYKITPAFNMELCERFGIKPLVFGGRSDALFHEFDIRDQRHMEYVNDHGVFEDAPIDQILNDFKKTYPRFEKLQQNATESGTGYDERFSASFSE